MNNFFEKFHPIAIFSYFCIVITFSMFFMHPIYLIISLVSANLYRFYIYKKINKFYFLIFILLSIINPIFSHEGATILFYLRNGNPMTLESIIYGLYTGAMFVSIIAWFSIYNKIMTSDKFMYIFGKIMPKISLLFSMVLRFIPNFQDKLRKIYISQKCASKDFEGKNIISKIKDGIKILSILVTWALESSIETADSMKARGYGFKNRTSFSNFVISSRDILAITLFLIIAIFILTAQISGVIYSTTFPVIIYSKFDYLSIICYILYIILCTYPLLVEIFYKMKWRKFDEYNKH